MTSENRHKDENGRNSVSKQERYTIFHALFEAMKDKDKKHKKS